MLLRWTARAAQDLYDITQHIQRDNPAAARKVATTIYEGCATLPDFPSRGRRGRREGTRELVFPGLPYIVVYRITHEAVELARIYHGAQDRRC